MEKKLVLVGNVEDNFEGFCDWVFEELKFEILDEESDVGVHLLDWSDWNLEDCENLEENFEDGSDWIFEEGLLEILVEGSEVKENFGTWFDWVFEELKFGILGEESDVGVNLLDGFDWSFEVGGNEEDNFEDCSDWIFWKDESEEA